MERGILFDIFWLAFFIQASNIYAASTSSQICVVGGGIAGLAAAQTLITAGFTNTKVIESGSKTGGRVMPVPVPGGDGQSSFDLSVQRLVKDSPLYVIAQAQNLLAPPTTVTTLAATKSYYSTANGCPLNKDLIDALESFADAVAQQVSTLAAQASTTDSAGMIYQKAFASYLQQNPTIVDPSSRFYQAMFDLERKAYEYTNGASDWNRVSAKQINNFKDARPSEMLNKNGFQGILNYYISQIGQANILLNTQVTQISYVDDAKVRLMFANNQVMDCDFVLVTIPLGLLKKNGPTLFNPPLPPATTALINNLGCDPTDTFVLIYDKPFWPKDMNALNLLRVKDDPWNCKVYNYQETEVSKTIWYLEPHPYQPNAIIGYIGGGMDPAYFESASSEAIMNASTNILKMFMSNKSIPYPKSLIRSSNGVDQNIVCSASYYTTECDKSGASCDRSQLENPIMINKAGVATPAIYIAGEAADGNGFGKANGAVASGIRVAKAIMAA
jgi:monoamine oxidase